MTSIKKIKIILKNNHPNLEEDFSLWLKSNKNQKSRAYYDGIDFGSEDWEDFMDGYFGCYPSNEDDYWDDTYNSYDMNDDESYEEYWNKIYGKNKLKTNKRGSRGKKKKKEQETEDYSTISDEELDSILRERKEIYYYDNICDKKTVHKFTNLRKFYEFIEDNGIDISDLEGSKFIRETIRHCCIDPMYEDVHGKKTIISDHSYGALAYEVSEDAALFRD